MRFPTLLVALVALSTSVMAAQILADSSDFTAPISPSAALATEILNEQAAPGAAAYADILLTSAEAANPVAPELRAPVPEPAIYVLVGIAMALLTIGGWRRHALLKTHRARSRRKRNERGMAYI